MSEQFVFCSYFYPVILILPDISAFSATAFIRKLPTHHWQRSLAELIKYISIMRVNLPQQYRTTGLRFFKMLYCVF